MPSHRQIIHPQETYRFSTTHTLSDYPLLIGEVLRRDQHRAMHKARLRAILEDLQRALGIRVTRDVGTPKIQL
jgi:Flp pilus assembly protein CpaB